MTIHSPRHSAVRSISRRACACVVAALLLASCAFDVVSVKQTATTIAPMRAATMDFVLQENVKVPLGTGFPTNLKGGTHWHAVGVIDQGIVFVTADQIVTVEASNVHEAQLVISKGQLVGFYLPVEHTFAPGKNPIPLKTTPIPSSP